MKSNSFYFILLLLFGLIANTSISQPYYWGQTNVETYTLGKVLIGHNIWDNNIMLSINSSDANSIVINHSDDHSDAYSYGILINVDNNLTKAFALRYNDTEVFQLWGNGLIKAKKIVAEEYEAIINSLNEKWPDYVLKDNYKLMSIPDLEKFIKKNHHLPEVPGIKELKNNNHNLINFDIILLKKIEEITLYIIEQQKEIERLKKLIENNENTH